MQWKLREFWLDENPGPVRVFTYDVALKGQDGTPQLTYRGDGIYHSDGLVRLNRERELRHLLDGTVVNAQQLIEHLAVTVRSRAERMLRQRVAAPGAPKLATANIRWRY